ncbi:MAG: UDP-N-acetylmuramate--L-alanine ligase [Candidatus Eisenbacteria bacterium]|uniref:UDP-N-acetylmuramate--L-alanine ligase n=1 Tax=Eiseniibacteriota bacterium TaxID=2212470 RepID=A0A948W7U2_UNCEI|nr:UDP-N-acetylmuramate--L-alanine ligase [Candidatus Eisenbacteria bacterium]MBU1947540.1 UDP-N-acetylmuramate--L-alanine ligase [Candidatus Eisenbacteria bacterium]MBU2692964.1 UDP-N-acetylmuramate--L-alanine ligase [Candidatus Eisenbacteria bacterium]
MSSHRVQRIHFVGIGGSGMSGLAEVLSNLGYEISGSDLAVGETVERLARLGCEIHTGHDPHHIEGKHLVVVSSAVQPSNPEWKEARRRKIPVLKRGAMLAEIMRLMKMGIAVAGTHGKTTTTSLVAHVLTEAGLDPTFVVGGRLRTLGSNARLGLGEILVAEADESDGSFLDLLPTIGIITNIDREHMEHFGTLDRLHAEFVTFANHVPFYGVNVVCAGDPGVREIMPRIQRRIVTYGLDPSYSVSASDIRPAGFQTHFRVRITGKDEGLVTLNLPGLHNVLNALAVIAVARELEISMESVRRGLSTFPGVSRRFEVRREVGGVTLMDDYGHHPTEIHAVLSTLRPIWKDRIVCLFQPHRYTRVRDMAAEFAGAFKGADIVVVTGIYPAGEKPIPGIDARNLTEPIQNESRTEVRYLEDEEAIRRHLPGLLKSGDLLVTLGAGNVWRWGEAVLSELEALHSEPAAKAAKAAKAVKGMKSE